MPLVVDVDQVQSSYANTTMAMLEEALSHAQTRAREAEEKIDVLTIERDDALGVVAALKLELNEVKTVSSNTQAKVSRLQTSVDNLMVQNEDLKAKLIAKENELQELHFIVDLEFDGSKSTKEELERLKVELANALSSNTEALHTISNLLDENEKLSKSKLSDADEFALLLDQYDVHNKYWTCEYNIAARRGNDGDSFRSMELKRWLDFLNNLKSNNPIILDKNDVAIWVGQLLNGYKESGCLHYFRPPAHGTVPHINYNLAKWLKQKGYLPSDFTGNLDKCCDERCEFNQIKHYHGTPHPTL
jgi:FtsZ-binding cell division protein ZapB